MDIYTQNIIFHGTQSPNKKKLTDANYTAYEVNTSCGDYLTLYLKIDENKIILEASFDGEGCSISQASASLLVEELKGMNFNNLKNINETFIHDLLGVEINPAREKCALLALKTLRKIK